MATTDDPTTSLPTSAPQPGVDLTSLRIPKAQKPAPFQELDGGPTLKATTAQAMGVDLTSLRIPKTQKPTPFQELDAGPTPKVSLASSPVADATTVDLTSLRIPKTQKPAPFQELDRGPTLKAGVDLASLRIPLRGTSAPFQEIDAGPTLKASTAQTMGVDLTSLRIPKAQKPAPFQELERTLTLRSGVQQSAFDPGGLRAGQTNNSNSAAPQEPSEGGCQCGASATTWNIYNDSVIPADSTANTGGACGGINLPSAILPLYVSVLGAATFATANDSASNTCFPAIAAYLTNPSSSLGFLPTRRLFVVSETSTSPSSLRLNFSIIDNLDYSPPVSPASSGGMMMPPVAGESINDGSGETWVGDPAVVALSGSLSGRVAVVATALANGSVTRIVVLVSSTDSNGEISFPSTSVLNFDISSADTTVDQPDIAFDVVTESLWVGWRQIHSPDNMIHDITLFVLRASVDLRGRATWAGSPIPVGAPGSYVVGGHLRMQVYNNVVMVAASIYRNAMEASPPDAQTFPAPVTVAYRLFVLNSSSDRPAWSNLLIDTVIHPLRVPTSARVDRLHVSILNNPRPTFVYDPDGYISTIAYAKERDADIGDGTIIRVVRILMGPDGRPVPPVVAVFHSYGIPGQFDFFPAVAAGPYPSATPASTRAVALVWYSYSLSSSAQTRVLGYCPPNTVSVMAAGALRPDTPLSWQSSITLQDTENPFSSGGCISPYVPPSDPSATYQHFLGDYIGLTFVPPLSDDPTYEDSAVFVAAWSTISAIQVRAFQVTPPPTIQQLAAAGVLTRGIPRRFTI